MEENNENLTEIYNDNQDNQDIQDNQDNQDIQEKRTKRKKTNYVLTPARKAQLEKMNQARKNKIEEKKKLQSSIIFLLGSFIFFLLIFITASLFGSSSSNPLIIIVSSELSEVASEFFDNSESFELDSLEEIFIDSRSPEGSSDLRSHFFLIILEDCNFFFSSIFFFLAWFIFSSCAFLAGVKT